MLAQVVKIFEEKPQFTIEDRVAEFEGRPAEALYLPEIQYDALFRSYGITPTGYCEQLLNLVDPTLNSMPLAANWVTSVDLIALYKGLLPRNSICPAAAIGVLETKDHNLVLGIRGGEITPERVEIFGSGLYACAPGGGVKFDAYKVDPITDTLRAEFAEELGSFNLTKETLLGVVEAFKPGPTGLKFVGKLTTDATLEQLQGANRQANQMYAALLQRGATCHEASQELEQRGLPPDAWEHTFLVGIPSDPESVNQFLKAPGLCGIGAGALMTYVQAMRRGI